MYWVGFPLAIALAVPMLPAGARGLRDAGLVRTNYRGAALAFPLGAILATVALVALAPLAVLNDRASLDLLPPELRRWLPYLLGIAFLGFLDDALGQGEAAATPRGWRGHWAALRAGRLSTGAIKAIGAVALAAYVVSGQGLETWRYIADVDPARPDDQPLQPARPAAGTGGEGAGAARRGALPLRLDAGADRTAGDLRRAGAGRRLADAGRAGDARRHRLEPDRGDRRRLAAHRSRRRTRV